MAPYAPQKGNFSAASAMSIHKLYSRSLKKICNAYWGDNNNIHRNKINCFLIKEYSNSCHQIYQKIKGCWYLAWDLSPVKNWCRWKAVIVRWQCMNIDWIKILMPLKEPLPERCHWQWPLCQEHEGNLGNSLVRIRIYSRNKGSPPQQFSVIHDVQRIWWRLNPTLYCT